MAELTFRFKSQESDTLIIGFPMSGGIKNYVNRNLVLTNVCLARAKSRLIYFVIDKF